MLRRVLLVGALVAVFVGILDPWSLPAYGLGIVVGILIGLVLEDPEPGPIAKLRDRRPFSDPFWMRKATESQRQR